MSERRRIIDGFSPAERRLFAALGGKLPDTEQRMESDMLVLTRRRDDVVEIQDNEGRLIGTVTIADVQGREVRLGLEFPPEYQVHRREVADRIRAEGRNRRAQ